MDKKKKVLIVDDDKDQVAVTRELLESKGFDVAAAHSGDEGRKAALAEAPDVVILDVMMETDTAGFHVARWLREQDATKSIPIIMLTGVNQTVPWRFGPDDVWLPVDVFMDKPVSSERLLGEVKKALGGK